MRAALALCVCVALRGGVAQSASRTECVQCGADPCLRTACTDGTCARDAMVAAARAAGYAVEVPGRCAVNRTYACAVNATGRSLSCDLAPDPAPTALLAAAPQLYPPNYMKKQFRPRYYSVPKEEADRGFTYDSLDKSGWAPMWTEGGQRKYFEPTWDFTTNRNENKWGEGDSYGLSTDQWLVLLTLLVMRRDRGNQPPRS